MKDRFRDLEYPQSSDPSFDQKNAALSAHSERFIEASPSKIRQVYGNYPGLSKEEQQYFIRHASELSAAARAEFNNAMGQIARDQRISFSDQNPSNN